MWGMVTCPTACWSLFQVSLQFSPPTAVPAEGVVLTVSAQPGSLCALSAVDQSVRIMEPGRRLSPEMVPNVQLVLFSCCTFYKL